MDTKDHNVHTPRETTEVSSPKRLHGEVQLPSDKSITHRAILLNALAAGEARVDHKGLGQDCQQTMQCLQALGVDIAALSKNHFVIRSPGIQGMREPDHVLDCGNSGTTMRLLLGLLAGLDVFAVVSGDKSLRRRPMSRLSGPLALMGARIYGRNHGKNAPLAVKGGKLEGIETKLPVASAQVKSALLIAGMLGKGTTTILQPSRSRNHTEIMLQAQGVQLHEEGLNISVEGGQTPTPIDIEVPGDVSSAAFWLTAGALHPQAELTMSKVSINPTRRGVIDVLLRMGAHIEISADDNGPEPTATLRVQSSALKSTYMGGVEIPMIQDEIPILALAATQAQGTTEIRDAKELRVKESDRISTTCRELKLLGAEIEELPDGLIIEGPTPLAGTDVDSHSDHRLAMCLGIAGLIANGTTLVHGSEAALVSDPRFWSELEQLSITNA